MTGHPFTMVAYASVLLTQWVFEAACSSWKTAGTRAQDLAENEKLHRLDVEATLAGDHDVACRGEADVRVRQAA